ncbi:MAG: hypothetical protein ACJA0H_002428, partial [Francisellaceae bacterium]
EKISCGNEGQDNENLSSLTAKYVSGGDHGSIIALLEIGMTKNINSFNKGVFYNLHPQYNKKSPYFYTEKPTGENDEDGNPIMNPEAGYHFEGNLCHKINPDYSGGDSNMKDIYLPADEINFKVLINSKDELEITNS